MLLARGRHDDAHIASQKCVSELITNFKEWAPFLEQNFGYFEWGRWKNFLGVFGEF